MFDDLLSDYGDGDYTSQDFQQDSSVNQSGDFSAERDEGSAELLDDYGDFELSKRHPSQAQRDDDAPHQVHEAIKLIVSGFVKRDVGMEETLGDLTLSSMEISSLHSKIINTLKIDPETFPVTVFFDSSLTIEKVADLAAEKIQPQSQEEPKQRGSDSLETILEATMECIEQITEGELVPFSATFGLLGLTDEQISTMHQELCRSLRLSPETLPLSWLSERNLSIVDFASRVAKQEEENEDTSNDPLDVEDEPLAAPLEPLVQPVLVKCVQWLVQLLAVFTFVALIGVAIFPVLCATSLLAIEYGFLAATWIGAVLAPVAALVFSVWAAILLVMLKWILLGKQKSIDQAVWSGAFARRWIVRQWSRLCWTYTCFAWLGETELLCWLYRLLGSKIGRRVEIIPGVIEDFDLVTIGDCSSVHGLINTERVSLGVQSLRPITVGRHCTVPSGCLVEQGVALEDNVLLKERTMVPYDSVLEKGSEWHGLPAKQYNHVVSAQAEGSKPDEDTDLRRRRFQALRLIVAFLFAPYLLVLEFGVAAGMGYGIWVALGPWGLGALVWLPLTTSCVLTALVGIVAKKILLGRVEAGSWPLHGGFHIKRYFVDHILTHHLLVLRRFAAMLGSPIAASPYGLRSVLRGLGVKLGAVTKCYEWKFLCYDLLFIDDGAFLGGGNEGKVFLTEGERLVGAEIKIGMEVTAGTKSFLRPNTHVEDFAAVAGFSFVSGDVASNEIVVGTKKFPHNPSSSIGKGSIDSQIQKEEESWLYSSLFSWLCASLTVFVIAVPTTEYRPDTPSSNTILNALFICGIVVATLGIGLPLYSLVVLVLSKVALVGRFMPWVHSTEQDQTRRLTMMNAWGIAMIDNFRPMFLQTFAGTFLEVVLYRLLGAVIGHDVYMDGIWMFEPNLVTIGHHVSLNKGCTLSPHQYTLRNAEFGRILIGDRCTIGALSTLHGRDIMDDDTEMAGFTMPLIGTHLTRGVWVGYPAARSSRDTSYRQPPQLPLPAWYLVIQHPSCVLLGMYWLILLARNGSTKKQKREVSESPALLPHEFQGTFRFGSDATISFEHSTWIASLRYLCVPTSLCVRRNNDSAWWKWACYHWTFDADLMSGYGQVSLASWVIPLPILTAKLVRNGDDEWIWSHRWFQGDPSEHDVLTLTRILGHPEEKAYSIMA